MPLFPMTYKFTLLVRTIIDGFDMRCQIQRQHNFVIFLNFLLRHPTSYKVGGALIMTNIARIKEPKKAKETKEAEYTAFSRLDGSHPFKEAAPFCYVDYPARVRHGGKVSWFNFELAREMGLISESHDDELTSDLEKAILDAFSIVIVNEYDFIHNLKISEVELKKGRYMATRYLQLQHKSKQGVTSGDGRSIWNGCISHKGITWDVSSCGTGATCLSPATNKHGKFFKTGDKEVSYGCGYSKLHEGLLDVIFSEVLAARGVRTERVLAVIEFPGSFAVTVRAGQNIFRPSHFFNHIKQGKLDRLKNVTDFYIDRQICNGVFPKDLIGRDRYTYFLKWVTERFAEASARFEEDYLFCWIDWDGDNIMADGGIIDYGSVRQFGVFHHEYRFDDDERWSTNIKEQKLKARYTVQVFAQCVDAILNGQKRGLEKFENSAAMQAFDRSFRRYKSKFFLERLGFSGAFTDEISLKNPGWLRLLSQSFYHLEMKKSNSGLVKVPDGKTWLPLYNMRSFSRELVRIAQMKDEEAIKVGKEVIKMSSLPVKFGNVEHGTLSNHLSTILRCFRLGLAAAGKSKYSLDNASEKIAERTWFQNHPHRLTGDGACIVAEYLLRKRTSVSREVIYQIVLRFANDQVRRGIVDWDVTKSSDRREVALMTSKIEKILSRYREGL